MKILITGGAGFIGSALIRHTIENSTHEVINVDNLTYAGNLESLKDIDKSPRYVFEHADICDENKIKRIFERHRPDAVMHLAAESHVDRSIDGPGQFIQTNIVGTYTLLNISRQYWSALSPDARSLFRFHHISTDEVYGDLERPEDLFTEETPYAPSSPYSASKASSDHLVRAWSRTYGLPVLITNCSNNYGPYHFPEKLIPHMILSALAGRPLPVYGDGSQIRDWLFVDDHVNALLTVLAKGTPGETYNIGGNNEKRNLEVVETICDLLDQLAPSERSPALTSYRDLITFVEDRPGHDKRYAIDARKIQQELDWQPAETFESGIQKTVEWYLSNRSWWQRVINGDYRLTRLGASK